MKARQHEIDSAVDPRAIFFGVAVDQALTLFLPWLVPRPDLRVLAALGVASTVLGGWVAGRIASKRGTSHGAAVGAVALAIGVASRIAVSPELPRWYVATMFTAVVPAGALGGSLARKIV